MRGIKFRAWHKAERRIYPVSCLYFEGIMTVRLVGHLYNWKEYSIGEEVELMEYIGRLDHHDIEMCEGDIIEYIDNTSRGLVKKIVVINDIRHLPDFSCSKWEEIIGNIYANPELLPVEALQGPGSTHEEV